MNHFAHSEASKAAKITEANLKNKIDEVEAQKQQAEIELRKCASYVRLWKKKLLTFPVSDWLVHQTGESVVVHRINLAYRSYFSFSELNIQKNHKNANNFESRWIN